MTRGGHRTAAVWNWETSMDFMRLPLYFQAMQAFDQRGDQQLLQWFHMFHGL